MQAHEAARMKHNGQCGAAELAAADLLAIRARIFAAVTVTFLRVASESGTLGYSGSRNKHGWGGGNDRNPKHPIHR